ncbi:MAG TPA: DUF5676 family membrane protein [Candidatus Nanoarchaeia archaeon]|nr:DUF5676 family membrane protein [Candidatus Nanoarchaeia archaeon]
MEDIKVAKAGIAGGVTGALLSIVCLVAVFALPIEAEIWIANSIMHSIDVSTVTKTTLSLTEALFGVFLAFAIGWFIGTFFALVYNGLNKNK